MNHQYDFILSFAGEDRKIVEVVRDVLKSYGLKIFYDLDEQHTLLGKDLAEHFSVLYKDRAKYCIIFVSDAYIKKPWCSWERRAALARVVESRSDYMIPYFLEDCSIPSIPSTIGRADLKNTDPEEFAALLAKKIFASSSVEDLTPKGLLGESISKALKSIFQEPKKLPYSDTPIRTEYRSIDEKFGNSFKPGSIHIIGSRPSVGKTSFALNIVERNIKRGRHAIYLTLADSPAQIALRLLSLRLGICSWDLKHGSLTEEEQARVTDAANSLQKEPLFIFDPISDSYDNSFDKIICELWRLSNGKKPCLIVVDYLQLLGGQTLFGENQKYSSITVMKGLEWLASCTGAVILVLSQLNRNIEDRTDKVPILSDLYGGKRVATLGHSCFLLQRETLHPFSDSDSVDMKVYVLKRDMQRVAPVNLTFYKRAAQLYEGWEDAEEYDGYFLNSDISENNFTNEENEVDIPF